MLGFGRKKTASNRVTNEMIYKLEAVNRRFPGVVPGRGDQVGKLALEIAWKVAFVFFDEDNFEKVLIRENSIERYFASGWSPTDALSRWYALGFICLTHCSMYSIWSDALTLDVGTQVYDAAVEKTWILWSMPDPVQQRVTAFMKANIKNITDSLAAIVDGRTRAVWFRRYAERIAGENPPWDLQQGGQSSVFKDVLSGGEVCTDALLISALSARYDTLAAQIMSLATGGSGDAKDTKEATTSRTAPNAPSAAIPEVSTTRILNSTDRKCVQEVATRASLSITSTFTMNLFNKLFGSVTFPHGWGVEDARSLWFALGNICLCASSQKWDAAFPDAAVKFEAQEITRRFMLSSWDMPYSEFKKLQSFMFSDFEKAYDSFLEATASGLGVEWFRRFTQRVCGMNPPWSVRVQVRDDPTRDGVDLIYYQSLAKVFMHTIETTNDEVHKVAQQVYGVAETPSVGNIEASHPMSQRLDIRVDPEQHPTENQIKELWQAWEQGGKEGLIDVFQKRNTSTE